VPARAVIDASVLLASLLPDEPTHPEAQELLGLALLTPAKVELLSTTLLPYELTNGLWQAVRQGRLTPEDIEKILQKYELFEIPLYPVRPKAVIALGKSLGYPSAYDLAYLALAEGEKAPLVTADRRLYNAVHEKFPRISLIRDFLASLGSKE
jgi:predicted nucleic acid-binding protein